MTAKRSLLEQKSQEDVISMKNKIATRKRQVRRTTELWKKLRKNCSQNIQEKMGKTKIQPQTEQRCTERTEDQPLRTNDQLSK